MTAEAEPIQSWRSRPLDERKASRKQALLAVATRLVGTAGTSALTTKAVSSAANLNERYVYESFGSRDELLCAVFDSVLTAATAQLMNSFVADAESAPADRLRNLFEASLDLVESDPGIVRILFVEAESDPVLRDRARQMRTTLEALTGQVLQMLTLDALSTSRASLLSMVAVGGTANLLIAWADGRIDLPRAEVLDLMTQFAAQMVANLSAPA